MILMFDSTGWFNDILRTFFGGIDFLIYTIVGWVVEGIFNLSSIAADQSLTELIYNRIYVILAIFMVFKLSFSFFKYLVNPDAMNDKEQGVGKLIARTITMLAILVMLPSVFFGTDLFEGQTAPILTMLQNGVVRTIPKIVLGISDESSVKNTAKENGETMALNMLTSLYYPNECRDKTECEYNIADLSEFTNSLNETYGQEYKYYYMWPLTTVCGVILLIILVGIAIDVAIRVFKLMILQMMAPIPVMTYIDPKASKDGAFNSWLKTFVSTYIDIFLKLATVYLLLLLVKELFNGNLLGNQLARMGFMAKNFVMVFLIIGLFKFAKDAPKFLKDAMGIKDSGGGGGFMGKALAGMAGAAAGFAGGVAAGGGIAGGLSGAAGGFSAGAANAGSGKPLGVYGKTRDEMAKSLGKTPGGVKGKMQQQALRRNLNKKFGLNTNTLAQAKDNMYAAQSDAALAQDTYDRFKEGNMSNDEIKALASNYDLDYDAKTGSYYDKNTGNFVDGYSMISNSLYNDAAKKQTAAAKAKSNYEQAAKLGEAARLEPGFEEKNAYMNPYKAIKDSTSNIRDKVNQKVDSTKGKIHDKVAGSNGNKVREFVADHTIMSESQKRQAKGGFDPNKRS